MTRVVVFGAGGPAGVNTCRALRMAGHDVVCQDDNPEHLVWCEPYGETTTDRSVDAEVGWAQPDSMLEWLSRQNIATLLPRRATIHVCQDKRLTGRAWAMAGLRDEPVPIGPEAPDWLHIAKDRFGLPFWLRAARGSGGKAGVLVKDLRAAYHWIRYWETQEPGIEFVAEEWLPGDDYCWTSLWFRGDLVAAFTRKRCEWLYGQIGTPSIVEVVHDREVAETALQALTAVVNMPHGAFGVDLKEDMEHLPRPTEINAGRWPTTTGLYAELGPNLPDMAVRLAAGETVEPLGEDIYPEMRMYRNMDCDLVFEKVPDAVA